MPALTRRSLLKLAGLRRSAPPRAAVPLGAAAASAGGQSHDAMQHAAHTDGPGRARVDRRASIRRRSCAAGTSRDLAAGRARAATTARRRGPTAPCCASTSSSPSIARSRSRRASSFRPGRSTARCPDRRCARRKAIASASTSSTRARTRTRFIFTAGIRPRWTARCPEHQVMPGDTFVYEFDAEPFGVHLYHCHAVPLKRHMHKGLYGMFIVDPQDAAARRPTSS